MTSKAEGDRSRRRAASPEIEDFAHLAAAQLSTPKIERDESFVSHGMKSAGT